MPRRKQESERSGILPASKSSKVLGLDTSSRKVGWGIVQGGEGRVQLIAHGLLTLNEKTPHPERMWRLYEEVEMLITLYGVDRISVESLKSIRNAKVARILEDYIAACKMVAWRVLGQEIVLLTQETIRSRIGVQDILPKDKKALDSKQRSLLTKERTLVRINNAFFNAGISEFDTSDGIAVAWAGLGGP